MTFDVSWIKIVNIIMICIGIGVVTLTLVQISILKTLRAEIRKFFQIFFNFILLYILTHLIRELLDGLPYPGVHFWQSVVTMIELIMAVLMTAMISRLILYIAIPEEKSKGFVTAISLLTIAHILVLIVDQFIHVIYYFDSSNCYHRGSLYILSNIAPAIMLVIDIFLLIRYRDKFKPSIRPALWNYILVPIAALIIQSFIYGLQFIIFVTVGASAYMFFTIVRDQSEEYEKQRSEKSRIETELNMASNIQSNMLPNIYPAFPEREEIDIYASMTPAKEVGGDFYDFFLIDDSHLGVVMADVSGKGVPAALFMMISKTLVQNNAMNNISPKAVLESVNKQMCSNNREGMFVTVWLGILDLHTGILTAANAGHEYPALKPPERPFKLLKEKHGVVVGVVDGVKYNEYQIAMEPGSKLFVYTDGVPEATNSDEELFGTDRMIDALNIDPDADPRSILKNVNEEVSKFVGNAPQFDDLTMLCLEYKKRI